MPTYEYECTNTQCSHKFEKFQSIRSGTSLKCPLCGKRAKRLIGTGGAIIFRGSGFYVTDYRSKDYKDKAKADKDGASASSTKSDSTKPDASKAESSAKSSSK